MKKNIYITTPIYYVNDKPHVGHAYTSIACDSLARFNRMLGHKVFFLTGTDEHGLKIQKSAEDKQVDTQVFVDSVSKNFSDLTDLLMLTNDDFIRTTSGRHKDGARSFWKKLLENNQIYLDKYAGWYSIRDEAYYQEEELVDGKAPTGSDVEWVEEPSFFFKLSHWQEPLLEFYKKNPDFVQPKSRFNEVVSFVESGLKDLSISRTSFSWGIEVPEEDKHVMYVWLDALTNYLTAIDYPNTSSELFSKFWPANFHVVGKDILRFHGVFWPAFLMAAELPLPSKIIAHGWWTVEKEKMSKSLGNVVDPKDVIDEFGLDSFRYFLLREVPFGNDGDFSEDSLISRINSDLANNFGNLVNRVVSMNQKNFNGIIPKYSKSLKIDDELREKIYTLVDEYKLFFESALFSKALSAVIELVSLINKYIDTEEPWTLAKNNKIDRLSTVLRLSFESIRIIAFMFYPVMPNSSCKILESLSLKLKGDDILFSTLKNTEFLDDDSKISKIDLLFPKIDKKLS
ncbi:MAG: methionine--tRNA ligase [Thermodesulfobacteriota bacteirum]|nr:methionine--tRNA ligase [Thermodesulfobacteriota bacterium]